MQKLGIKGDESILDVGCGDGAISAFIANHYLPDGTMHGIDISNDMIATAIAHHSALHITFEQADLLTYHPTKQYDIITCFWVLYLFDDYTHALNQVISLLKPGGRALICHLIEPGTPFLQAYAQKLKPTKRTLTLPSFETIATALAKIPAKIQHLEIKYNHNSYPDLETLIENMTHVPFLTGLSVEKRIELYQELPSLYPLCADGGIRDSSLVVCMVLEAE